MINFQKIFKTAFSVLVCPLMLTACHKEEALKSESEPVKVVRVGAPLTKVKFGMLPYGDHTFAVIGVKNGWFKEVGIDLEYQVIKVENVVPFLKNNSLDVASCPPGILMANYEMAPNVITFCFGDLFQGFAIMAKPEYKSFTEFVSSGMPPKEALKATALQMKGKTFAYPTEAAIKPFIDLVVEKSGMTKSDFRSLTLDDPMTIIALRKGEAQFQVGGAPSRVVLQREGFKPLIRSVDIAATAAPSPDSPELASVLEDGWATTREYFKEHHDLVLKLASVNFRILKYMNEHQTDALALHMPYLSQVTGQKFTPADGKIIYEDLDPFITFEKQKDWFENPKSLYYYKNINGAILKSYLKQSVYKQKPPTVDDVVLPAVEIYKELKQLKSQTDALLAKVEANAGKGKVKDKIEQAKHFYDAYDFVDSKNLAEEAAKQLGI